MLQNITITDNDQSRPNDNHLSTAYKISCYNIPVMSWKGENKKYIYY